MLQRKKKFRGKKRHLTSFYQSMKKLESYNFGPCEVKTYENHKIPIHARLFKVRKKLTREILNQFINSTYQCYLNNKCLNGKFTLILSYPNCFNSEVCVFYTSEYYDNFIIRQDEHQRWEIQKSGIVEELKLNIPKNCEVKNFNETIKYSEDLHYNGLITIIEYGSFDSEVRK
jgi:hypothetical protein